MAAIKDKESGKKDANTKITLAHVTEEKTEELGEKPLCRPPSSQMIH